jgi:hypothetical protein
MPAGEDSCNAKLGIRDGYCQLPGVAEFNRCRLHSGNVSKAFDLFKKNVDIVTADKLQTLLEDTLSMDNELASGKALLLDVLNQYHKASIVMNAYEDNMPKRPTPYDTQMEKDTYHDAVTLHIEMMNMAKELKEKSFYQAQQLIKTLSNAVAKNNRIREGAKFTMDAKQISSILKLQLTVMKDTCAGCGKLRMVLKGMREGTKDIPLDPHFSKENRETIGNRQYKDMLEKVKDLHGDIQEADFEIEETGDKT